jgi:hypothetical protein
MMGDGACGKCAAEGGRGRGRRRRGAPAPVDFGVAVEDGEEAGVRLALVAEERLAALGGEPEVGVEDRLLHLGRGEVAVEVEPALAHGDAARVLEQAPCAGDPVRSTVLGVVGVCAGGAE